jgi:EmrB/QacA subfamily drug resistance transporter
LTETRSAAAGHAVSPVPPRYTHRQILEILGGLMLAMLTSMLSSTVVSTALPTIVGDLGGQEHYSWVASATLLTMTASTPLWGKVSDLLGRKLMFQVALGIFVVASMAAGFSQNMWMLIAARAVQGIGAGGLSALTQVILGDVVEPRERGRYSGYLGAVFGVATVAGPLLGGFLVDHGGWRWCFFVGVPLAVIAFVVIQKVLKLPRSHGATTIDGYGAFTITAAAAALMLMLSFGGQQWAWNSAWTYILSAIAVLMVIFAVVAERRAKDPILAPRLFRNRTFVQTSLASLFVGMAMFGGIIYLPQYLQTAKGMSPTASGLMMLPMVVTMFLGSIATGQIVTRTGRWKIFPAIGMLLVAAGMFLMHLFELDTGKPVIGLSVAVVGLGLGMTMQTLILAAQNGVDRADMAATTAGVSFFRNLGGAIGVAAFGAILQNKIKDEIADGIARLHIHVAGGSSVKLGTPDAIQHLPGPIKGVVRGAYIDGIQTVFLWAVPVAVIGFLMVLLLPELKLRGSRGDEQPAAAPPPAPSLTGPRTTQDALVMGLLLELIAARVQANPDPSLSLTRTVARMDAGDGDDGTRARRAADLVLRPLALDLLRRAASTAARPTEPETVQGGVSR